MNEAEKLINQAKTAALFNSGKPIIACAPPANSEITWGDLVWSELKIESVDPKSGQKT